jgi:hypothetical protein
MTRDEWYANDANRIQLAELLKSEPLNSALNVLISNELSLSQGYSEANPIEHAAIIGQNRDGYFRFLRNLKSLSQERALPKDEPIPWGHVKPK